jgi:hypothetical protein
VAVTSPAPAFIAALPPTMRAPSAHSALALAMTLAGASLAAPAAELAAATAPAAPEVSTRARATTSSRSPALPVARLALQNAPPRRRPVAVVMAVAITALCVAAALAVFGHPSLAATGAPATPATTPGAVAREIAIAVPASAAPLAVATDQAPSASPSPTTAASAPVPASSAPTPPAMTGAPSAAGKAKRVGAEPPVVETGGTEAPAFAPDRGRVAVVREDAEGFERHLVNELLGHASLERCYIEALKAHGSAATGSALLTLQVAAGKVAAASLSTDLGLPSLRPCLDTQLVGQPMGEGGTDEGAAEGVAHVTLQLTDL